MVSVLIVVIAIISLVIWKGDFTGTRFSFMGDSEVAGMSEPVKEAVSNSKSDLSKMVGVSTGTIKLVSTAEKTWSTDCLDVAIQGEICSPKEIPGLEVVLSVYGKNYTYHTNADGKTVRFFE